MTLSAKMRERGMRATLMVRGRSATTDTGEAVFMVVQDQPPLDDPDQPAQSKTAIYCAISIAAWAVADPRAVKLFTESEAGGRAYRVLRYDESSADAVVWKFFCEAQRL